MVIIMQQEQGKSTAHEMSAEADQQLPLPDTFQGLRFPVYAAHQQIFARRPAGISSGFNRAQCHAITRAPD